MGSLISKEGLYSYTAFNDKEIEMSLVSNHVPVSSRFLAVWFI